MLGLLGLGAICFALGLILGTLLADRGPGAPRQWRDPVNGVVCYYNEAGLACPIRRP